MWSSTSVLTSCVQVKEHSPISETLFISNFFQGLSPSMGEGGKQMLRGPTTPYKERAKDNDDWVIMEGYDDNNNGGSSESSREDSRASCGSMSSSDMVDDASSSSHSSGPLYELSELMAQLPIK